MSDRYPMMLYSGDAKEPQTRIVSDETDHADAAGEGFKDAGEFFGLVVENATAPAVGEIVELCEMVAMLEQENAVLREKLAAFDRDGNGSPGGSKPRGNKPADA